MRIILLGITLTSLIVFSGIGVGVVQAAHHGTVDCFLSVTGSGACSALTSGIALVVHHLNGFHTLTAGVITLGTALLAAALIIFGNVLCADPILLEARSVLYRRSIEPMRRAYAPLMRFLALRTRRIPDIYSGRAVCA